MALVGCSSTPEDETPAAGNGSGAPGGSSGSGGSAGAITTGGAAGNAAGGSPSAGAAGASAGSTGNGLPDVGCDYTTVIGRACAISGCHTARFLSGDLDLTVDAGLRRRLADVTAKHSQISCDPNDPSIYCVPAACPTNAKIVDTTNPDASWVLAKLSGTPTGCGDSMPLAPGNAADRWDDTKKACLVAFFRAIADGPPGEGTGGTAGSGGTASGGAGSGGAGSGGVATGGAGASSGGGGNGGVATGGAGASTGGAGASSAGSGGMAGRAGSSGGGRAGQGGANGGVSGNL